MLLLILCEIKQIICQTINKADISDDSAGSSSSSFNTQTETEPEIAVSQQMLSSKRNLVTIQDYQPSQPIKKIKKMIIRKKDLPLSSSPNSSSVPSSPIPPPNTPPPVSDTTVETAINPFHWKTPEQNLTLIAMYDKHKVKFSDVKYKSKQVWGMNDI